MDKITVKEIDVRYKRIDTGDFICLTDIARYKNPEDPRFIVYSWLRNKNTIVFLGLWEELHNPDFNRVYDLAAEVDRKDGRHRPDRFQRQIQQRCVCSSGHRL